jgi:hypothetical protein
LPAAPLLTYAIWPTLPAAAVGSCATVRVGMRALVVALRLAAATVVVFTVAIVAVSFTSGNAFPPRMRCFKRCESHDVPLSAAMRLSLVYKTGLLTPCGDRASRRVRAKRIRRVALGGWL